MNLNDEQAEAVRILERHIQDHIREIMQFQAGEKPDDHKLNELFIGTEKLLDECKSLKVAETATVEATEYENYTTVKFSIADLKAELKKWRGTASKAAGAKKEAEKETAKKAEQEKEAQALQKLKDRAYPFISTFNDRLSFFEEGFVKKVKALDPIALASLLAGGRYMLPSYMDMREHLQKLIEIGLPDDLVLDFERNTSYSIAELKKLIPKWAEVGETAILASDPSLAFDRLPEESKRAKQELDETFEKANKTLNDLHYKGTDENWSYYQKNVIDPLKKAFSDAKKIKDVERYTVGTTGAIPFEEAAKIIPSLEKRLKKAFEVKDDKIERFRNNLTEYSEERFPGSLKRYDAQRAKFTKGLSGDKLSIMEDMLMKESLSSYTSEKGYGFRVTFYDVDRVEIETAGDFAKAKIWGYEYSDFASDDYLKLHPRWYVWIKHFDKMKLVNETKKQGNGIEVPASEYVFKPKK